MRIAVSCQGPDLASVVDPRFGRAAHFIVYDTDSESCYTVNNSDNAGAAQGAGIQAAQVLAQRSVDVVVSGNMGPKAFEALRAAGIQMIAWDKGTVSEAIELVRNGQLQPLDSANARGHWR
jgi:predicted Fe-Mo cluster-binding NifX family protein